jgi:integrase
LSRASFSTLTLQACLRLSKALLKDSLHRLTKPLRVTVHGFRSTFRDWANEQTEFPNDAIEMALAHAVGSKVEQAYRRSDMLEKRRALMTEWGAFCDGSTHDG